MRRRRKCAKRWAALLLALPLAAGIVLFAAHLHRIFLEYAINECEDNALMEIGSLMEDEVYAHPERYTSLVQLDYDSERHVTALRTDVVAIGRIKSRLVNGLYDRLDEFEQTVIEVPLGSLFPRQRAEPAFRAGRADADGGGIRQQLFRRRHQPDAPLHPDRVPCRVPHPHALRRRGP